MLTTENILTGLANSMHLLQELCGEIRLEILLVYRDNATQLFSQGMHLNKFKFKNSVVIETVCFHVPTVASRSSG